MRIPTLVTVPSPGKRGRRLRPSLVGEGDRSGLGQTDSLGPPGRSDTYGLPGGVPVGLVATCQSLLRGSGEAEGDSSKQVIRTKYRLRPRCWKSARTGYLTCSSGLAIGRADGSAPRGTSCIVGLWLCGVRLCCAWPAAVLAVVAAAGSAVILS